MSGEKSMERSVHEEYVENLIDSMLHNMDEQSSNVLLIEHYNTLDLTYEQVMEISAEKTNVKFLYHSYETGDIIAAFEPFLDWIKELFYELSDESLEEFFENAGVYILHRPIFKSYFETGVCRRKEEVLIKDSYKEFFQHFHITANNLFEWGLENVVWVEPKIAAIE
jgi:hypothetical protein